MSTLTPTSYDLGTKGASSTLKSAFFSFFLLLLDFGMVDDICSACGLVENEFQYQSKDNNTEGSELAGSSIRWTGKGEKKATMRARGSRNEGMRERKP